MKILVACEESQAVCIEMRKLWHEAYSCDILPCSWWHPERHIQWDAIETAYWQHRDMMIAHPPCTYLSYAWIRWFDIERYWEKAIQRHKLKDEAIDFFLKLRNAPIEKIAIENPRWFIQNTLKQTQIIQPRMFWDEANKPTLLWLKNLKKLEPTNIVWKWEMVYHISKKTGKMRSDSKRYYQAFSMPPKERAMFRSKTFPWIAKAMAEQRAWPLSI